MTVNARRYRAPKHDARRTDPSDGLRLRVPADHFEISCEFPSGQYYRRRRWLS